MFEHMLNGQMFFQMRHASHFSSMNTESGDRFCHGAWVLLSTIGVYSPQPSSASTSGTSFSMACSTVARWPGFTLISAITVIMLYLVDEYVLRQLSKIFARCSR